MSQQSYSNGQTAFIMSQIILWVQRQNAELATGSPDFFGAAQLILPVYAASYKGEYYITASQPSAPVALPTAQVAETAGSFYEVDYPTNAVDNGIVSLEFLWNTSNLALVTQPEIKNEQLESEWDVATTNTTVIYWRMAGRKIRIFVPVTYVSMLPEIIIGFNRYPTYPAVVGDTLDVPADDFQTFYNLWTAAIIPDSLTPIPISGYMYSVTPTGTMNGTNMTFTLPASVAADANGNPEFISGTVNNNNLIYGVDFSGTVGSPTVTMLHYAPVSTDVLRFSFISIT